MNREHISRRRKIWSVFFSLIVFSITALLVSCGGPKEKTGKPDFPVPVELAKVEQKDTAVYLEGIGNIAAYNVVDIKARVTGELIRIFFKEGDYLKPDQDIFTIDPAPFEAKVKEIDARVNQSRVQYEQAKREYKRFQTLHDQKAISLEQLETKEVDMNAKFFEMRLHEAELETALLNLSYCHIKSPIAGKSGEKLIDNFNMVNANQDKLVTIRQTQPIKAKFSLPGKYLLEIQKFAEKHPLEVTIKIGNGEPPETGVLTLIDSTINPRTGMIALEGTFENKESKLWPGQFVHVRLKLREDPNSVVVSDKAVNDGPDGQFAWVVAEDQSVSMRPMKVARRDGGLVIVAEGLKPGETVVTSGALMLRPGAKVITREQMRQMQQAGGPPSGGPGAPQKAGGKGDGKPETPDKPPTAHPGSPAHKGDAKK